MHAGKRLALATCAGFAVAAALSGPAMADPGLSGVTEPLPPVVAEPVEDIGTTAEQLVEQVQPPVNGFLQGTTELVDDTGTGVQETVDTTLGAAQETVAPELSEDATVPVALPAEQVSVREAAPAQTAVSPDVPATESATPTARSQPEVATTTARPTRARSARPESPATPVERPPATAVTLAQEDQSAVGASVRDRVDAPAPSQPTSFLDLSVFGGSVPQPPPALLIALLLGFLALAAPRAGGPRLHPAVALPRPADVRFRLVRPG